jgi:hypothetical protein
MPASTGVDWAARLCCYPGQPKGHQHRPCDPAALHGRTVLRQGHGGDARQGRALLHGHALRVLLKLCAAVDCQPPAQPQHEESAFGYRQQHQKRGPPHIVMPAGPAESAQTLARGSEHGVQRVWIQAAKGTGPTLPSPCDSERMSGRQSPVKCSRNMRAASG